MCFYMIVVNLIAMLKMVQCNSNSSDQKAIFKESPLSYHEEGTCVARLGVLERKVDHQNQESGNLKAEHEELKIKFGKFKNATDIFITDHPNYLKSNVEGTMEPNIDVEHRVMSKRPARLLPLSLFQKPRNTSNVTFNDPPTNCGDLSNIGYTLNGFYPVQLKPAREQLFGKMGMIYCNFQPESSKKKPPSGLVENRVGLLDVKSSSIHFYVQKNVGFDEPNKVIPYEVELLNVGQAMNLKTGIFKAPLNGIYYFSFRAFHGAAAATLFAANTKVSLRLNGKIVTTGVSSTMGGYTFSLECTLKLKKGDRVDVKKGASGALKDDSIEHLTHFSGHLLEEDLTML